jgi:hypothetical protein
MRGALVTSATSPHEPTGAQQPPHRTVVDAIADEDGVDTVIVAAVLAE